MDPFASVDLEAGEISASQEDLLRRAPFLNGPHSPAPSPSPSDIIFITSPSPTAAAVVAADAPIFICTLPDTQPSPSAAAATHSSPRPRVLKPKPQTRVTCHRTRPPLIRTPSDDEEDQEASKSKGRDDFNQFEALKAAIEDLNAAPASPNPTPTVPIRQEGSKAAVVAGASSEPSPVPIQQEGSEAAVVVGASSEPSPVPLQEEGSEAAVAAAESLEGNSAFPASLADVVNVYSGEPSGRFADMDILEVAAMKGIHFSPPRWWRPEGYDK